MSAGQVEAVLARFAAGRRVLEDGFSVRVGEAGPVNALVRIVGARVDWAVRVAGAGDDALVVSRVGERDAQTAAARLGFAPAVVYADPANGVLVSTWIDAPVAAAGLFVHPEGLARVAQRVRALHASPPPVGLRVVDAQAVARNYLGLPAAGGGPVPRHRLEKALAHAHARRRSPLAVFCHNDLHQQNVLDAGQLWFIDWEYAGLGDPLFELAGIAGYHDLRPGQVEALVSAYGGVTAAELAPWQVLFDVVHALWLDVAGAWDTLALARREALVARLCF